MEVVVVFVFLKKKKKERSGLFSDFAPLGLFGNIHLYRNELFMLVGSSCFDDADVNARLLKFAFAMLDMRWCWMLGPT